jgi:hypothetical protein
VTSRERLGRAIAVVGLLCCLGGAGFTAFRVFDGLQTGVVTGRYGSRYFRAEGDFFYYSTVTLNAVGCLLWLGLAAFAVLVLVRWEDWT